MVGRRPSRAVVTMFVVVATVTLGMSPGEQAAGAAEPVSADSPQSGTPLSLEAILAATPAGTPDSDGDGLPDPVEAVYGTMADEPDSDLDGLGDYYELANGLDPTELDTNKDGLPDGLELDGPVDPDGDLIANVWDDDNDNDGVVDGLDLSPFAVSAAADSMTVDVATTGNATYLDLQVRPADGQMDLTGLPGNWPLDEYGTVQDLDDYAVDADVHILPMLQLSSASGPQVDDMLDYGIIPLGANEAVGDSPDLWRGLVPLGPVIDYRGTAALSGRMFFPEGVPDQVTVQMVWAVVWTDRQADTVAIADTGTTMAGGVLHNLTKGASCTVRDLLGSDAHEGYICQEPLTGGATFQKGDLLSYTYTVAGTEHSLETEVVADAHENSPVVARYATPFLITGMTATESHGAATAVFYGDDQQVFATGLVLSYEYLRDSNDLASIAADLDEYGITDVEALQENDISDIDAAYVAAANELLPAAVDDLPPGEIAPVLVTFEDDSTTMQPIEWARPDPQIGVTSLSIDLTDPGNRVVTRSMRLDWIDPASGEPVADFVPALEGWNLDEATFESVALLAVMWAAGDSTVVKAGGNWVLYEKPEWYTLSEDIVNWVKTGFDNSAMAVELGLAFDGALKAFRHIKLLRADGWSVSLKGKPVGFLGQFKQSFNAVKGVVASSKVPWASLSTWGKVVRGLKFAGKVVAVIGVAISIGFVTYTWVTEGFEPAMWEALVAVIVGVGAYLVVELVGALVMVGPVGWAILAIGALVLILGEIFGDWVTSVWNWLTGLTSPEVWPLVVLDLAVDDGPNVVPLDLDDNGFDVGDELIITTDFMVTTVAAKPDTHYNDMIWSGLDPRLAMETCLLHANGQTTCLPATGAEVSQAIEGPEADLYTSAWQAENERWYDPPELVNSQLDDRCDGIVDWAAGDRCRIENLKHTKIRLLPKMATTDLSLNTGIAYHAFVYVYKDYSWPREDEREQQEVSADGSDNRQPMDFDVLPGSLADFMAWPALVFLDTDRDGVVDGDDSYPTEADHDGDGLNDGYERDLGTDPGHADTDRDAIPDGDEVRNGTSPTEADTDGDTIDDATEAQGWQIEFEYFGTPFTTAVTANPLLADADGDTLTDPEEWYLGTNPNAWDTDGDGYRDGPNSDPVATGDTYTVAANQVLAVAAPGLLANDFDNDGDAISIAAVDLLGTHGTVTWTADGSFTYDPAGHYDTLLLGETATDTFFYVLGDARGRQDGALVAITVTAAPPPGSIFTDDEFSIFEADIEWLAASGITKGCNPPVNDMFCPNDSVTRGQMAAFLHRALGDVLTPGPLPGFTDIDGSVFEADIEWLGSVGVTKGCNPPANDMFCPLDVVTRGQMAAFLVRALGYTAGAGSDRFTDDDGSVFEADIERLAEAGVTKGCNPPTNDMFCPNAPVTRAQMAAFLHRALGS